MSIDLRLAFRSIPDDLERVMADQRFVLTDVSSPVFAPFVKIHSYYHRDPENSVRGVHFMYHDRVYEDTEDDWKGIVENPREIMALGTVATYMGRSAYDLKKQWATARFLRDHYAAVLYDPQHGRLVID